VTHEATARSSWHWLQELPWRSYLGVGVGAGIVLATALCAALQGAGLAILVLGGAGLLTAIGTLWTSVRALVGELPMDVEDAYALAAPAGADDQKRALLRALEDLDYEKRVGKISEQDFGELGARYRAEAKQLLGVDEAARDEERRAVERLVADRLAGLGLEALPDRTQEDELPAQPAVAEEPTDEESDAAMAAPAAGAPRRASAEKTAPGGGPTRPTPQPHGARTRRATTRRDTPRPQASARSAARPAERRTTLMRSSARSAGCGSTIAAIPPAAAAASAEASAGHEP
jgi:hypothetical protein